ETQIVSTECPTWSVSSTALVLIGGEPGTCAWNALTRLASRCTASPSWSSYRSHAVGRLRDQLATAVVLPQPAAPITTQIRRSAARSRSSPTDGRSTRLRPGPGGSGRAGSVTLSPPDKTPLFTDRGQAGYVAKPRLPPSSPRCSL